MYKDYRDIFNQRGVLYHQAMMRYPQARRHEFEAAIATADLQHGHILCDVPSGGCYISRFLEQDIKLFSIETSTEFIHCATSHPANNTLVCEDLSHISLLSNTVDRAISLAGSHHLTNRPGFYSEVCRILRPGGVFCLADVREGSGVDGFLNVFVDQHNSMGHNGDFLRERTRTELEAAGFRVTWAEPKAYHWLFDDVPQMVDCCRCLFGIDQATDAQILAALEHYLGFTSLAAGVGLNWELYFFKAVKPAAA